MRCCLEASPPRGAASVGLRSPPLTFLFWHQLMRPLTSKTFWSAMQNSWASMPPLSCNACSVHPEMQVHFPFSSGKHLQRRRLMRAKATACAPMITGTNHSLIYGVAAFGRWAYLCPSPAGVRAKRRSASGSLRGPRKCPAATPAAPAVSRPAR